METEMEVPATDVDLDFILDKRARELFGEGYRRWDLARTGKLVKRVRMHNPQDQIDRTINEYPKNPEYPN